MSNFNRHHSCPQKDICGNECIDGKDVIEVHKNLLNVCRVPLAAIIQLLAQGQLPPQVHFSQVVLTYEIILINKSPHYVRNVGISDSLAAIALAEGSTVPFRTEIEVVGKCDTLVPQDSDDVIKSGGQLLKRCKSYLRPCSTTKIILKLALSAPDDTVCEIRQVQNSICVDGDIECKKLTSIVKTSPLWETASDISFVVGLNFNINFNPV